MTEQNDCTCEACRIWEAVERARQVVSHADYMTLLKLATRWMHNEIRRQK